MIETIDRLFITDRDDWRKWLRNNYDKKSEVWLIYYKRHTGKPSISYDDSVEEALCFGWIDSIIRRIDDERFARKFTPRKKGSRWSEVNKKRGSRMIEAGNMTEAGLARIREAKRSGEWYKTVPARKEVAVPPFVKDALSANKKALENFNSLAQSYKRQYIGWIMSAKREKTRKRRLAEAIQHLEKNEKLGMK